MCPCYLSVPTFTFIIYHEFASQVKWPTQINYHSFYSKDQYLSQESQYLELCLEHERVQCFLNFLLNSKFLCAYLCTFLSVCAPLVCRYAGKPEVGIRSLGIGATGYHEVLDVVLGTDGPLQG